MVSASTSTLPAVTRAWPGRTPPARRGPPGAAAAAAPRPWSGTAAAAGQLAAGRVRAGGPASPPTHSGRVAVRLRAASCRAADSARSSGASSRSTCRMTTLSASAAAPARRRSASCVSRPRRRRRGPRTGASGWRRSCTARSSASLPTPGSPSTASHSPAWKAFSTSWQARSHNGAAPTRPGSSMRAAASRAAGVSASASPSLTWTTTPAQLRRRRRTCSQYIRAGGAGRQLQRDRPAAARAPSSSAASAAWASSAAWSAGSSMARAWSLSITASLVRAKTMPGDPPAGRAGRPGAPRARAGRSRPSSACWICSAVALARVSSSDSASLRQQVRSTAPTVRPGDRVVDRHAGAGQVLQVLGVVLVAEHVGRGAGLQRGADAVGADELLGVAEAGREQDAVEVALEFGVGRAAAEHQAGRVGEDDADRLAVELLAQPAQHPLGAAGQRGVDVRIAQVGQLDLVGGHVQLARALPRGQDRPAAPGPGRGRLGGQEAHARLGQLGGPATAPPIPGVVSCQSLHHPPQARPGAANRVERVRRLCSDHFDDSRARAMRPVSN